MHTLPLTALTLTALLAGSGVLAHRSASANPSALHAVPAFPGAQGGGARSVGGRGGEVIEVTNLRDSGAGSLRACVEARGPRTCVFTVGGVIAVKSNMTVTNPYLTIAGQTAPGGGIALAIVPGVSPPNVWIFDVQTHDVVIRFVRFWGDYIAGDSPNAGNGSYGVVVHDPASAVIIDHCDLLWFTGKAFGGWGTAFGNLTLQWSIVAESVNGGPGGQSTPILVSSSTFNPSTVHDVDLHHNLIASGDERNPLICSDSSRIINNIIYNWMYFAVGIDNGGTADIVGNYWKPGPSPKSCIREILISRARSGGTLYLANNKSDWSGPGSHCATDLGLRGKASGAEGDGGWSLLTGGSARYQGSVTGGTDPELTPLPSSYKRSPLGRLRPAGIEITPDPVSTLASMLEAPGGVGVSRRLDCNGRWVTQRDAAESRILRDFVDGVGPSRQPRSAADANRGPVPVLAPGTPCTDSDHDGMPDVWEASHGLNPADPSDGRKVNPDGYTHLEHYLNGQ